MSTIGSQRSGTKLEQVTIVMKKKCCGVSDLDEVRPITGHFMFTHIPIKRGAANRPLHNKGMPF